MADNVEITQGSGTSIATEDVGGIQHQKVKVEFGGDGVATLVSSSDPLPVTQSGVATAANQTTIIGHLDGVETVLGTIDADTGAMATDLAAIETLLTTIETNQLADNHQVTANLSATDNAVLDSIVTELQDIETDLEAIDAGKLEEATFTGRIGEVQATPTANTLLGRVKSVEDKLDTLETTANAIQTAVEILDNVVSGSEAQVDVVSSVLPTGAATAANQSTEITHLSEIEGAVETIESTVATIGTTPLQRMALFDASNNQITSFGGGTQYATGTAAATPTGTQINWDESGTQRAVSTSKPLPVSDAGGSLTVDRGGGFAEPATDGSSAPSTGYMAMGQAGSTAQSIKVENDGTVNTLLRDSTGDSVMDDSNNAVRVNVVAGASSTQYDDGEAVATPTGTMQMWWDDSGNAVAISSATPLPVSATLDTTGLATSTKQDDIITALGTTNSNTAALLSEAQFETTLGEVQANPTANTVLDRLKAIKTSVDAVNTTLQADIGVNATLQAGTNAIGLVGHDITGIGHGVTTVTTAGTDVALASSTACKKVTIQAQTDNTGLIAVGATGVDATVATGTGIILYPGDSFEIEIDNLNDIYIDSTVNGEGVRYTYFT